MCCCRVLRQKKNCLGGLTIQLVGRRQGKELLINPKCRVQSMKCWRQADPFLTSAISHSIEIYIVLSVNKRFMSFDLAMENYRISILDRWWLKFWPIAIMLLLFLKLAIFSRYEFEKLKKLCIVQSYAIKTVFNSRIGLKDQNSRIWWLDFHTHIIELNICYIEACKLAETPLHC